jgi:hypothetical protein
MIAIHRREQKRAPCQGLQNDRVFGGERPRAFFELPGSSGSPRGSGDPTAAGAVG